MDSDSAKLLIEQYEKELAEKSPEELSVLAEAEKLIESQELTEFEARQWFNGPDCRADLEYWSKASGWSLEEGMALSLGKDPRKVTWDGVKSERRNSPFVQEYEKRLELGRRAVIVGNLGKWTNALNFMIWLRHIGLSYPPELEVIIVRASGERVDWKARYDEETAAHAQCRNELQAQIAKVEGLAEKRGWQRERESLLKLAIGMAVRGYSYVPTANKNAAVKEIADDLQFVGLIMDEDTVRKYLQEGKQLIPGDKTE